MGTSGTPEIVTIPGFLTPQFILYSAVTQRIYVLQTQFNGACSVVKVNPFTDAIESTVAVPLITYIDVGNPPNAYTMVCIGSLIYVICGGSLYNGFDVKTYDTSTDTFTAVQTSSPVNYAGVLCSVDMQDGTYFVSCAVTHVVELTPTIVQTGVNAYTGMGGSGISPNTVRLGYHSSEGNLYGISSFNGYTAMRYGGRAVLPISWAVVTGTNDGTGIGTCYVNALSKLYMFSQQRAYRLATGVITEMYAFNTFAAGLQNDTNPVLAPNGKIYFGTSNNNTLGRVYSYDPNTDTVVGQSTNGTLVFSGQGCYCPVNNNVYFPNGNPVVDPNVIRRVGAVF